PEVSFLRYSPIMRFSRHPQGAKRPRDLLSRSDNQVRTIDPSLATLAQDDNYPRVSHANNASPKNNVRSAAGARKTPNGTSGISNGADPSASSVCSRACPRRINATGMTRPTNVSAPSVAPKNTVMSARAGPSAAPTNAISVTSPKPIASRLVTTSPSQPTMAIIPAPAHAPTSASYGVANS